MSRIIEKSDVGIRLFDAKQVHDLLNDQDVIEIMANPDGRLFVERFGKGIVAEGTIEPLHAETMIRQMATRQGEEVNEGSPIVSAEIGEGGHRFEGILPPVADGPMFAIRRRASKVYRLDSYVERGALTKAAQEDLRCLVRDRKNIIVAGATSSGKTTFLNALLAEIELSDPDARQIIIEDTREVQTSAPNTVALKVPKSIDAQTVLKSTLRLRPDRIHVGEVRDGVALTLLKAWNTGHAGGMASIHANSAQDALVRLGQLIAEVSAQDQSAMIASAVDAVIFLVRGRFGPTVQEVLNLKQNVKGPGTIAPTLTDFST